MTLKMRVGRMYKSNLFRYLFVGVLSVAIDYASFHLLNQTLRFMKTSLADVAYYYMVNVPGTVLGFLSSFFLNKYWSFESKRHTGSQLLKYTCLFLFNTAFTSVFIERCVQWFSWKEGAAKIIAVGMVATWNYALYRTVVFKNVSLGRQTPQD